MMPDVNISHFLLSTVYIVVFL